MPKATATTGYYAVARGRVPGIYFNWPDCEEQVKGFVGAKYKKFHSATEADEWKTQQDGGIISSSSVVKIQPAASTSKGKEPIAVEDPEKDVVYCDGACKGNGKPGSVAGVGVWWGHGDPRNIAERCPGGQTNNRAELIAIVRVLETTPRSERPLLIKTDSQYSIKCFKQWLPKWRRNGFMTTSGSPVANQGIIRYLDALLTERGQSSQRVDFEYVQGHVGIEGNEGADAQANLGCELPEVADLDWEAKENEVMRRIAEQNYPPKSPIASTSHAPLVQSTSTAAAAAIQVEKLPPPAFNIDVGSSNRFPPAVASAAPAVQGHTTSTRLQRIEQAVQNALRSPRPESPPAAPVTPTKPPARAAEAGSSRRGVYTVTRPARTGVTTLTSDGVFATAAARAAFTSPSRPVNSRGYVGAGEQETDLSTAVSPLPVRRRDRLEPTYRSIGIEAKLCDCSREGTHRHLQSRKRSASPPSRRSQPPATRTRKKDHDDESGTQESVKSLERTQAISITESDMNAYAEGLLPDDQLLNELSF